MNRQEQSWYLQCQTYIASVGLSTVKSWLAVFRYRTPCQERLRDSMMSLLFDAPVWFILLLIAVGVVLAFMGLQRQQNGMRNTGIGMICAALLLFVLRMTVETDEKRVEKDVRGMMDAISKNDWAAATLYLSRTRLYTWEGDDLIAQGKRLSSHYGLTGVTVNSIETRREPNVITATVSVTSHHKGMDFDSVPSTWNMEYQKRQQKWVCTSLLPTRIGVGDVGRLEDIIRIK